MFLVTINSLLFMVLLNFNVEALVLRSLCLEQPKQVNMEDTYCERCKFYLCYFNCSVNLAGSTCVKWILNDSFCPKRAHAKLSWAWWAWLYPGRMLLMWSTRWASMSGTWKNKVSTSPLDSCWWTHGKGQLLLRFQNIWSSTFVLSNFSRFDQIKAKLAL
jgi:hypothetical protein